MTDGEAARRTPRQRRGEQRVEEILDAAALVFGEVGYEAATTNAIAARAGASIGSLYQFFRNKDEVMRALAGRYNAQLREIYDHVYTPESMTLPLPLLIDRLIDPLVTFCEDNAGFERLFASASLGNIEDDDLDGVGRERLERLFLARARTHDPAQAALTTRVCVLTVSALLGTIKNGPSPDQQRLIAEFKRLLVAYLTPLFDPR